MQVTITLNSRESYALCSIATRELRKPKDQARYLLRQVLGLNEHQAENESSHVEVRQDLCDAAAAS